jgi:hypothetical protein
LLWSLAKWWAWLFDRHLIEANVFELVGCREVESERIPPLTLRCLLQRHVAEHLDDLGIAACTREWYLVWLRRFEVFLNRLPAPPTFEAGRLEIGEEVLAAWFRHVCGQYRRDHVQAGIQVLNGFFEALVRKGVLVENALDRLRREYPAQEADRRGLRACSRGPRDSPACAGGQADVPEQPRRAHGRLCLSQARHRPALPRA